MERRRLALIGLVVGALAALPGCVAQKAPCKLHGDLADYQQTALDIEYPCSETPCYDELLGAGPPRTPRDETQDVYWDLSLEEAIRIALTNSRVMLDLGGTVLRAPESVPTAFGPAIQETDPQFGVEAALSAFDAEFSSSLFFEKNDRRMNNQFLGTLGFFQQDYDVFQAQITKRAATGSQFAIRKNVDFNHDNNLGNQFKGGAWDVILEGEVRHPFLRGGGLYFNRIAGPDGRPGYYNGVLVARVKTDISLAEFEIGLRDLVANVENAYWDLYYSYRDLDAWRKTRDLGLETWRRVYALYRAGRRGGEAEKEAQARERYLLYEDMVLRAKFGQWTEGSRTYNPQTFGRPRTEQGVYAQETRLRLLLGLPPNDGRLIRPADEPPVSPVTFDWATIATEALTLREELRRQRWEVKNRELELIASRNFLLPNLDFVGRYRFRGFGHHLLDPEREGKPRFDNAFMDLTDGKFQEWQMGMELSLPIGFRQGHAALRNAELRLTQARAVLRQQERQVVHDLYNAVTELERAYEKLNIMINRAMAAKQQLDALQAAYDADKAEFFVVLDAQRRYAEAESDYYKARVEYAFAIRNVFSEKGSLLEYCGVYMAEGRWPEKAYHDAAERACLRGRPLRVNYGLRPPIIVSQGAPPVPCDHLHPEGHAPAGPSAPFHSEQGQKEGSPFVTEPVGPGTDGPPAGLPKALPSGIPHEPVAPGVAEPLPGARAPQPRAEPPEPPAADAAPNAPADRGTTASAAGRPVFSAASPFFEQTFWFRLRRAGPPAGVADPPPMRLESPADLRAESARQRDGAVTPTSHLAQPPEARPATPWPSHPLPLPARGFEEPSLGIVDPSAGEGEGASLGSYEGPPVIHPEPPTGSPQPAGPSSLPPAPPTSAEPLAARDP